VYVRVRVRVRKGSEMVLPNQGSTDFVRTPRPWRNSSSSITFTY